MFLLPTILIKKLAVLILSYKQSLSLYSRIGKRDHRESKANFLLKKSDLDTFIIHILPLSVDAIAVNVGKRCPQNRSKTAARAFCNMILLTIYLFVTTLTLTFFVRCL